MEKVCQIFLRVSLVMGMLFIGKSYASWSYIGNYTSHVKNGNEVVFTCGNAKISVQICAPDIARIRMVPSGNIIVDNQYLNNNGPYMVIKYDWPSVNFTVTDGASVVTIETNNIIIEANKMPFRLTYYDKQKKKLCSESDGMGWDDGKIINTMACDQNDHFYGLGADSKYNSLDQRGYDHLTSINHNPWCTDMQAPFFMNTKGYGIFLNTAWVTHFDLANRSSSSYSFSADGGTQLDYYFIYGPSFYRIIDLYTTITGKPCFLPRWAFLPWPFAFPNGQDNKTNQTELNICNRYRTDDLPSSLIMMEPGFWLSNFCSMEFKSTMNGPDLIRDLAERHMNLGGWVCPFIGGDSPLYNEALNNGYFLATGVHMWWQTAGYDKSGKAGILDFTNMATVNWWGAKQNVLTDMGMKAFKVDCIEDFQNYKSSMSNGMTTAEAHNLQPLVVLKGSFDEWQKHDPNSRPVFMTRTGYSGIQRYCWIWSSDQYKGDYQDLIWQMRSQLNNGLSGVAFWGSDIGALDGTATRTSPETYSRWIEFGLIGNCITELCSGLTPWSYGVDVENIFRKYAKLRSRLVPYLYSYNYEATQTGAPVIRALIFEFQDDPAVYPMWNEYLSGKYILLAPVTTAEATSRDIYLPKGKWFDYWDGTEHIGPKTITGYSAPVDKLPIFIRGGAIIPMGPEMNWDQLSSSTELTFDIYPADTSSFNLYEDDGVSRSYQKGSYALTKIQSTERDEATRSIIFNAQQGSFRIDRNVYLKIHTATKPKSVFLNKTKINRQADTSSLRAAARGWSYDPYGKICWVKFHHTGSMISIGFNAPVVANNNANPDAINSDMIKRTAKNMQLPPTAHPVTDTTDGWRDLFAKDLSNAIVSDTGIWAFEPDGVLSATKGIPYRVIWTKAKYTNFIIDLEFRNAPKTNSGVVLRSSSIDQIEWVDIAPEVQIMDSYGKEKVGKQDCGAIYECLEPALNMVKKPGEWNRYTITCLGSRIYVILNGRQIIDMDMDKWTKQGENPDGTKNKFKGPVKDMSRSGYIGLQYHGVPVCFRNIRIKSLN